MSLKTKKRHAPERYKVRTDTNSASAKKNVSKTEKRYKDTVFAPILLIVVFALILSSRLLSDESLGLNENPYLSVVVIQLLTYAIPSLFYIRLRGRDFTSRVRMKLFEPGRLLYVLHSTVFMLCGIALLSIVMYALFPEQFSSDSVSGYAAFAMNGRFFDGVYLVITFALLPAVTEELLFRGIISAEYEGHGVGVAVMMSAFTFAMSHFSLARFPVYLFSGIVMALTMYATRSVFASMIMHAVQNSFVILSEKYVLRIADNQNASFGLFLIIIGAVLIVSGMLACYEAQGIYRTYAEENYPSDYIPKGKRVMLRGIAESFFTPTFLILVIIFVVVTAA